MTTNKYETLVVAMIMTSQIFSCKLHTECTNNEIRLVPGSGGRQYVQYCSDGEWKSMCTDGGTWTTLEATVACRQLGYSDQGKHMTPTTKLLANLVSMIQRH